MGSTVILSSDDEDSDISESEMDEYGDKMYLNLKGGKLKVTLSPQTFVCPYCPNKKKPSFQYKDLLQHASGVGNSNSDKRSAKEKASHLALFKYLQQDLADSAVEAEPSSKRQKNGNPIQDCDQDEKLVYPWKGTHFLEYVSKGSYFHCYVGLLIVYMWLNQVLWLIYQLQRHKMVDLRVRVDRS